MANDYDVIVVGGGSPGEHCVGALVEGGLRVALVERELVGGECSYYACIPSKTLLRPGEAVQEARDALATADVDVEAALAWRDCRSRTTPMPARCGGWPSRTSTLIRGSGRLAGTGVVEVDGNRHTADHVVVAVGADPFIPPVPGLRELEGVWTNREVTGMKAVPQRLLILGGGPVGVEMAQAVLRFGGEVVHRRGRPSACSRREPAPLGEALGEALRARRDRARARRARDRRAAGRRRLRARARRRPRAARRPPARGHRPAPARGGDRPRDGRASSPTRTGSRSTRTCARASACGRVGDITGIWPLTHVGKYQGEVVAANILGEPREANYDAVPRVSYTDPQAGAVGATEAKFSGTARARRGRQDRDLHARVRRVQRLPDAAQRR